MKIWIDGATTEVALAVEGGEVLSYELQHKVTSNEGEYLALIHALGYALGHRNYNADVYSDSELLVKQLTTEEGGSPLYACRKPELVLLREIALMLVSQMDYFTLNWVPREENPAGVYLEGGRNAKS